MGEAKRWKKTFFEQHPLCCFCGGVAPATTVDHQPGRVYFRNREWPEGFAFPACEPCNSVSKDSERIVAVLVHGHANADADQEREAYRRNLESVRRDFPDEIRRLIPDRNERREVLRSKGILKPPGMLWDDIPLIKMRKEFWEPHLCMLARKLLLALHYQCFGKPLSPNGALWYYIHTNADFAAGEYPPEIFELVDRLALPVRNRQALQDQFAVRWNVVNKHSGAIFLAQFHKMLTITGITTERLDAFAEDRPEVPLRPFGPW